MAYYDGYYTDPQQYGYTSDQYDYGASYEQTPPPPPDRNWEDPMPVVRTYLERIQQDCIQEGFKDLKDTNIYSLEALVGFVELYKDQISQPIEMKQLFAKIKFPTLGFLDMNDESCTNGFGSEKSRKSKFVPSFSDLFQNIFEVNKHQEHDEQSTGYEVSQLDEQSTDSKMSKLQEHDVQSGETDRPSIRLDQQETNVKTSDVKQSDTEIESENQSMEVTNLQLNKGKSVILTMSGLEMIQNLQCHPIILQVRVMQTENTEEVVTEVEAVVRLPESFRQVVLQASNPTTDLPLTEVTTDCYPLLDEDGSKIGEAQVTLTITCLGGAIINSLRTIGPGIYLHEKMVCVKTPKNKTAEPKSPPPFTPAPGNWKINIKSSEEILRSCGNELHSESTIHPQKKCCWFNMTQDAMPKVQEKCSTVLEEPDYTLFAEHRTTCRELLQSERKTKRPSVLELLDSLLEEAKNDKRLSYRKSILEENGHPPSM